MQTRKPGWQEQRFYAYLLRFTWPVLLRSHTRLGGGANNGFGDARKDIVIGPGRFNFDTSLYKTFNICEVANFEFCAGSFNAFNHTEFNNIGSSFGRSTFGQATNTWDPRVLQFGGKFNF